MASTDTDPEKMVAQRPSVAEVSPKELILVYGDFIGLDKVNTAGGDAKFVLTVGCSAINVPAPVGSRVESYTVFVARDYHTPGVEDDQMLNVQIGNPEDTRKFVKALHRVISMGIAMGMVDESKIRQMQTLIDETDFHNPAAIDATRRAVKEVAVGSRKVAETVDAGPGSVIGALLRKKLAAEKSGA